MGHRRGAIGRAVTAVGSLATVAGLTAVASPDARYIAFWLVFIPTCAVAVTSLLLVLGGLAVDAVAARVTRGRAFRTTDPTPPHRTHRRSA